MNTINIGLIGMGTVGGGVFAVLQRNAEEITRRTGQVLRIVKVAERHLERAQQVVAGRAEVVADAMDIIHDPAIHIVLELIGGTTIAKDLVLASIAQGKHVITANKALLAQHGEEIVAAAQQAGVIVAFEAAVAGGIPIIKVLREGLASNRILWVAGIINGTTNFILSQMRHQGLSFADALQEAQRLGYAEADPTFDVEGIDAAHKLTILSTLAFGVPLRFDQAYIEGINHLSLLDIRYAEELGYRVKLLGITKRVAQGIELRVHPTLIPEKRLVANVDGAMNAVLVCGDAVGPTLYYGAGAGSEPTASAVVADVIDVARLLAAPVSARVPMLAFPSSAMSHDPVLPMAMVQSAYYLRLRVADKPGVLAEVSKILADRAISIEALLQKEPQDQLTDIVILTDITQEANMDKAIEALSDLPDLQEKPIKLRMESLSK